MALNPPLQTIADYLQTVAATMQAMDPHEIKRVISLLHKGYQEDKRVLLIGNGGSAANASHFAEDLCKGALLDSTEKRFDVLSLTDNTPFITAVANDLGYEHIFTFQLRQFARPGDILVAISGSGNSANIIAAAEYARKHGITVVAFTGYSGGKLIGLADYKIHVPLNDMCQTEAVHSVLMHLIVDLLRECICQTKKTPST